MRLDPASRYDRTWMARATARYGHRAIFVWLISVVWIVMAVSIAGAGRDDVDHLFHTYLPLPVRAAIWGVPAIVSLAISRTRLEWISFILLAIPPGQRVMSFWTGAALGPHPPIAWEYVGRGTMYLLIVLLMWLVGTWPNPVQDEDFLDEDEDEWGDWPEEWKHHSDPDVEE